MNWLVCSFWEIYISSLLSSRRIIFYVIALPPLETVQFPIFTPCSALPAVEKLHVERPTIGGLLPRRVCALPKPNGAGGAKRGETNSLTEKTRHVFREVLHWAISRHVRRAKQTRKWRGKQIRSVETIEKHSLETKRR